MGERTTMRAVIIDPDAAARNKIEKILLRKDIAAELSGSAADGKEGYRLISEQYPDLIVMDIDIPEKKGISLLRKLRKEKCGAEVIILTKNRKFECICQAMELGAAGYFLKPLKTKKFVNTVQDIKARREKKKTEDQIFSPETVLAGCISGLLHPNMELNRMTQTKFGFTLENPADVFVIWMGSQYEKQKEKVKSILNGTGVNAENNGYILCSDVWQSVMAVFCGNRNRKEGEKASGIDSAFERNILPVLCGSVQGELICTWFDLEQLRDISEVPKKIQMTGQWNLLFDRGELIRYKEVANMNTVPLKYPAEIEEQARQAVIAADGEEIKKCYYRLYDVLRRDIHSPEEMKECLIRFNIAIANVYKINHIIGSEMEIQHCMQAILLAVSWRQIRTAMEKYMHALNFDVLLQEGDEQLSPLVRKALQLVRKYYDQGITLEELADMLFVSEEYLSSQFKKETGTGFAETVKKYRINRIKELLLGTHLKVNQIAELTGYSDPKYMSRVFKEETGVLPTEFRKSVL